MTESELDAPQGLGLCSRCKTELAVTLSRKELFCKSCFVRFISGKQRRHMIADKYKVKFGNSITRDKVVFPISFGPSSLVLLDILLCQFNEQLKNPRVNIGFELDIVFVDDSKVNEYKNNVVDVIQEIKSTYDTDRFPVTFTIVDMETFFTDDSTSIGKLKLNPDFTSFMTGFDTHTDVTMEKVFKACPNRASKHDLQQIVLQQLIKGHVKKTGATSVLWGHNMTTLAEQVLALTVKGRGAEIYLHLTDFTDEIDGLKVDIVHPLRDASKGEIDKFVSMRSLEKFLLVPVLDSEKLMNKQRTINEVVSNYYKSVDTADDNIVSTVVKTGAKLAEPKNTEGKRCLVCQNKIYNRPMDWLRDITFNGSCGPETDMERELLEEWMEANKDTLSEIEEYSESSAVDLCYGCAVTVGGHAKGVVYWPAVQPRTTTQAVLDEFVIGDDDDDE